MPPSYNNYVEWGKNNSFNLVKPFKNIKYKFTINHMKNKVISYINITRNGKFLILGYNNGVIEKYVLQKIDESKIISDDNINNNNNSNSSFKNFIIPDFRNSDASSPNNQNKKTERKKSLFNTIFSSIRKKSDENTENETVIKNLTVEKNKFLEKDEPEAIEVLNTINVDENINNNNNIKISKKTSNKMSFDTHISISFSNILNSDCILLNNKSKTFYQYNSIPSNDLFLYIIFFFNLIWLFKIIIN